MALFHGQAEEAAAEDALRVSSRHLLDQQRAHEATRQAFASSIGELTLNLTENEQQRFRSAANGDELRLLDNSIASLRASLVAAELEQHSQMDLAQRLLRQSEERMSQKQVERDRISTLVADFRRNLYSFAAGQLAVGVDHACAIHRNGTLICWGRNDLGQAELPPDLLQPSLVVWQVFTGDGNTCVIVSGVTSYWDASAVAQRELRCWGNSVFGKSEPPPLSHVLHVSLGATHSCAITAGAEGLVDADKEQEAGDWAVSRAAGAEDGVLTCWGSNQEGQAEVPRAAMRVKAVACGLTHTCAITVSGDVVCWGERSSGRLAPPTHLQAATSNTAQRKSRSICAGAQHSCAVDVTGALSCWGSNARGQSDVPVLESNSQRVSCGGAHTCVVSTLGVLRCFGSGISTLKATRTHTATPAAAAYLNAPACSASAVAGWRPLGSNVSNSSLEGSRWNQTQCLKNSVVTLAPDRPFFVVQTGWNYACGTTYLGPSSSALGRVQCWGEIAASNVEQSRLSPPASLVVCATPWE